jgi:hypothetical protein
MAEKMYTIQEGIEKGFLENKVVYVKPIPKKGNKMITDPAHVGYFMWEGARKSFCLPLDKYGVLANPFKNEEEALFFSKILDLDLNTKRKDNNFWHNFYVNIIKTPSFMASGEKYNLADPMDNVRVRILLLQEEVAPSWDARFERPGYKFAIVAEDYQEKTENIEMEILKTVYTFMGSIENSPKKMQEFLGVYLMHKKINKEVPKDATKEFLNSELQKAIKEDQATVYKLIKDEDAPIKFFIYQAVSKGYISKKGIGTYVIVGEEKEFNLNELVSHIKFLKDTTDPIYLKLEAQLNKK